MTASVVLMEKKSMATFAAAQPTMTHHSHNIYYGIYLRVPEPQLSAPVKDLS